MSNGTPDDTGTHGGAQSAAQPEAQRDTGGEAPAAAGARLKWARERAGLTVNDVAARLRLHPAQVRALEAENFKALPEPAYVRGFVRSYARILELPVEPLLADLTGKLGPTSADVIERMTRERDYSPVRAAAQEQASRRVVLWGAVLLLVLLGFVGWYATRGAADTAATVAPPPAVAAPAPAPQPSAVVVAQPAPVDARPDVAADVVNVAATTDAQPAAAPAAEPVAMLEPVAPAPLLKLRFSGPSWTEVRDAEGKVLHSRQDAAGDEVVIEGTPPFYVVLGDANRATVEVRGEIYDMAPHTRQNVARFTVN